MNTIQRYVGRAVAALIVSALVFTGCEKEEDLGKAPRLFSPIGEVTASTVNVRPHLSMDLILPVAGASKYVFQLFIPDSVVGSAVYYKESNLVATQELVTTKAEFGVDEDLIWDQQYVVTAKAVGDAIESKKYVIVATTDDYPSSLKSLSSTEIIDEGAIVRWGELTEAYSVLDITNSSDSILFRFDMTNYEGDSLIIEKLTANTTYRVKAYVGSAPAHEEGAPYAEIPNSQYRGKKAFKTVASQIFPISVDLRGLSSEEAKNYITSEFLAGLEDGTVVLLKGGENYVITAPKFTDKAVTFVTGYTLVGQAKMEISSDFKLTSGLKAKELVFENIYLYTSGVVETTPNYGGKYVFNMDQANTNVALIRFKGCTLKFFRGIIRSRATTLVDGVEFDNCVLTYIGGYGLMNVDDASGTIMNMTLINSTLSYAEKVLVNSKNPKGTENVIVKTCTFANSPLNDGKSYMFDFNTVSPKFAFGNCIFSKSREGGAAAIDGNGGSLAFRAGSSADFSSCYKTADFIFFAKTGVNPGGVMEGINNYSGNWDALFKAPLNFDYTIKDGSFAGAKDSGDPRWWR